MNGARRRRRARRRLRGTGGVKCIGTGCFPNKVSSSSSSSCYYYIFFFFHRLPLLLNRIMHTTTLLRRFCCAHFFFTYSCSRNTRRSVRHVIFVRTRVRACARARLCAYTTRIYTPQVPPPRNPSDTNITKYWYTRAFDK